ncbi:hypothetical protein [Dactylosporangium salmoneum]|uniref:Uncharacterized protein n=1 Tax=Dactylosporangium salmoneum TaxID=53361 RepID=A0ABP5SUH0_9ACTN
MVLIFCDLSSPASETATAASTGAEPIDSEPTDNASVNLTYKDLNTGLSVRGAHAEGVIRLCAFGLGCTGMAASAAWIVKVGGALPTPALLAVTTITTAGIACCTWLMARKPKPQKMRWR